MKRIVYVFVAVLLAGCGQRSGFDLETVMQARPNRGHLVFDYVGTMADVSETTARYLENIRETSGIEILVVAIPTLEGRYSLNEAAVEMFSNWGVGREFGGRGLLLLLVDDEKQVRLEIGYELEDVFTDLFSGHAQDKQLRPYYSAGQLETGLIAVLEELEARAGIKAAGDFDRADIEARDARYLSQGAGARYELEEHSVEGVDAAAVFNSYPAGETPRAAWGTLINRWRDRQRSPDLGVFTPTARLAYRDYTNMPDSSFDEDVRTYAGKDYTIRQDGDYAVIYFGKKKGWENSPFLLCRTDEGWQFDLVNQRRYIRMGPAPDWGVEFSEHPYMGLLMDTYSYSGQDIPLEGEDRYTIYRDAELAEAILDQEALHQSNPEAFEPALALGRLYSLTAMGRKAIGVLRKAKQLNPEDPRPDKYLAIANVGAYYQYDTALANLEAYIEKAPEDVFGHNFKGYILFQKGRDAEAAAEFETALTLMPEDACYTHYYLARAYLRLYDNAASLDPRKKTYHDRLDEQVSMTRSFRDTHPLRVEMLNRWVGSEE